ncbi:hypothetical protein [Companilactobacillus halodurans]|uniref:Uncharacterized protein n=1 Tax=Companilactobacillus halodurans TaxID=2584183 RepID=A0A5P0ZVC9_9LACO|nr:hypothetical protein [Companilactobacillus halodurans]MQS96950.1 hypothetical protein [Companilactobacillus halodurans]
MTPTEVGTKYYQQKTAWYMFISALSPTVWSQVAAVHTLDSDVDVDDLTVTTDDDYIYNQTSDITTTSTYARAHVKPENFTGTIKWSIDKPELATIDEETGLITANNRSQSGEVTVTATAVNSSNSAPKEAEAKLMVGGGLEDQTVNVGEKATFALMGNIGEFEEQEDLNYSIRWFKEDPITHEQSEIEIGKNSVAHTTDATTLDDDGAEYFAHIEAKTNGKTYEYDTNKAKLHVLSTEGPTIELDETIKNNTYDNNSDTEKTIYDVISQDKVVYNSTITNTSNGARLKDATYTVPLRSDTKVNKVLIDGEETNDYSVTSGSGEDDLKIKNLAFGINQSHEIEIQTTVSDVNSRESFRSNAHIEGTDDNGNTVKKSGDTRTLNLITNKLEYQVNDIDYGTIKPIGNEKVIYRQDETNWPNNIMNVDDMRRSKSGVQLYLSQAADFTDDSGNVLQGHLKYYDDDGEADLLNNSILVSNSTSGQGMNSLSWRADKGVLLEMDNRMMNASGNYHTKLNWTFVDSLDE